MSGAWVTWPAELRTWPGINDITPQLDHAIDLLQDHRDLADATYDYTPGDTTVTFHLLARWGITEPVVTGCARVALHQCLPNAGLGLHHRDTWPRVVGILRFPYWPTSFRWW